MNARPASVATSIAAIAAFALSGCSVVRAPRIDIPESGLLAPASVTAPADAGKPATVDSSGEEARMKIPAGSTVTVTRTEAVAATPTTPARPAMEVREIQLMADTEWYERAQRIAANSGAVDTSVAMRRLDNESRKPLLYAAIGAVVVAGVLMFSGWPKVAVLAGGAAVVFFAAWQVAGLPAWFWMLGAALLFVGAGIVVGWLLRDRDSNGVPDILERKRAVAPYPAA